MTELSLARSCVEPDDAGLLERDPSPVAPLPGLALIGRVVRRPASRLAVVFSRAAAAAGVDGDKLDTFDALALRRVALPLG